MYYQSSYMKNYTLVYDDEMEGPPPPTDEEFEILHPLPVQKLKYHPAMIPATNVNGLTAAHEALATVELLEMILENVDIHTLLLSQRVHSKFRACIRGSFKLQHVLFQAPWNPSNEREEFRFNNLLMDNVKSARKLGVIIRRQPRGNSGLWEFHVFITTALLLKPPIGSSAYWAGFCTRGYKCLEKGPDIHEEDMHIIKIYFKDTQDLSRPFNIIHTMEPTMGHVYHFFERDHPNLITTEEELFHGFTMGGFSYARFMDGRARQAEIVAQDEVVAEEFRKNTREHRAKRRAERLAGKSDDVSPSSSS